MSEQDPAAIRRRDARREWHVVKLAMSASSEAPSDMSAETALASMWQLALDAWAMTGRPLPAYSRAETPVKRLTMDAPAHERYA
ncbi:MAG: hypothetical protein AB7I32_07030 [Gammaproteobacteria bacterium]